MLMFATRVDKLGRETKVLEFGAVSEEVFMYVIKHMTLTSKRYWGVEV